MIEAIWELLTTFTDEARSAAVAKCTELGFDTKRGLISLDESLINLNSAKAILVDMVEKQKLIQLPITVQKVILSNLDAISRALTGLVSGSDEVENLVTSIERLNTTIWQYGLHNLSGEVLGYQTKLNELKKLELNSKRIMEELQQGLEYKSRLETLFADTEAAVRRTQDAVVTMEDKVTVSTENANQAGIAAKSANDEYAVIQQISLKASEVTEQIEALNEKADAWAKDIEQLAKKAVSVEEDVMNLNNRLQTVIENTESTFKRVEDLLPGATSAGLASAFRSRKDAIAKSKKYWIGGFVISLIGLIGMIVLLILNAPNQSGKDWWQYLVERIPMTFPFIWLGWFFGRNYGHAVRLEEDYAFKESISRSFEGYKKQMQEVDIADALPRLCQNTIRILSETPLRVFDRKTSDETPANSILDKLFGKEKKRSKEEQ
jgi:hypothetical protein